jgi:hypothetical protein
VDGSREGKLLVFTYHSSRDYGCDCLASATVPYLSTQSEDAYCSFCSRRTQVGVSM